MDGRRVWTHDAAAEDWTMDAHCRREKHGHGNTSVKRGPRSRKRHERHVRRHRRVSCTRSERYVSLVNTF